MQGLQGRNFEEKSLGKRLSLKKARILSKIFLPCKPCKYLNWFQAEIISREIHISLQILKVGIWFSSVSKDRNSRWNENGKQDGVQYEIQDGVQYEIQDGLKTEIKMRIKMEFKME